jgi:hypothetical protein
MVLSFIKGIIVAQYICVNKLTMAQREENEEYLTTEGTEEKRMKKTSRRDAEEEKKARRRVKFDEKTTQILNAKDIYSVFPKQILRNSQNR